MKLNLGGVKGEKKGFKTVNIMGGDFKLDLNDYPYPFEDNSVEEIYASHILEHLKEPHDFMKECYRVLKKGGTIEIRVPHYKANNTYSTFEHRWQVNEHAIRDFTGVREVGIFPFRFKLLSTYIKKGRFLFWQKREIWWVLQKVE